MDLITNSLGRDMSTPLHKTQRSIWGRGWIDGGTEGWLWGLWGEERYKSSTHGAQHAVNIRIKPPYNSTKDFWSCRIILSFCFGKKNQNAAAVGRQRWPLRARLIAANSLGVLGPRSASSLSVSLIAGRAQQVGMLGVTTLGLNGALKEKRTTQAHSTHNRK